MSNSDWSIERSLQLYNIPGWGAGYFSINPKGHMVVHPFGQPGPVIDLMDVVDDIRERKLGFPCVVRFQDLLRSRVKQLNDVFRNAIAQHGYKGQYFGVYPTKVNQMREVVEEILDAGAPWHFGLEAGSKGELLIVLALNTDPEALTICNGYKDEEYLRLALIGRKLGRKILVVIEKLSELPHLLRLSEEMNVQPLIGLRSKLSTKGTGKWESSSGDFAKFGLTTPELIRAIEILRAAGKVEAAKLFHFHVGSQLTDIRTVKDVVNEGARFYAKLRKMGLSSLEYFDVGGGLGVDYVGARSTSYVSSLNYSMEEYAADVVYTVQQICSNEGVPEPNLVSESGRALTAHHACLLMNVFGHIEFGENGTVHEEPSASPGPNAPADAVAPVPEDNSPIVREMREIVSGMTPKNSGEAYNDAVAKKEQALTMFKLGILGLEERAAVEGLFWRLCRRLVEINKKRKRVPGPTRGLDDRLADQYMANFSLFQSAPDSWAINQLFPIVPLHRHTEQPTRDSTIVDITCDSDGKIDIFIEGETVDETIALHPLRPGEPYYLGMFLTGAYQDIMGDMHNLFGRVHEVHVFVDDDDPEDFYIEEVIPGDTMERVLARVQYEPSDLAKRIKQALDGKVREGHVKPKESVQLTDFYEQAMRGYTYLGTE
ncbi:MAG: arginine decarboxylase [Deltaproteobacteria bacterium 13_1_40CM_3_69_14]|nr:MAG: arginine decarboxylase [Deltaproteobacteria bacterium 13_1_40CM_3_69_14]